MEHRIVKASGRSDFSVDLEWDCGAKGTVDLAAFVADGEVTRALRNPDYFVASLRVDGGGDWISWPNGVDIDADALWYLAYPADWAEDHEPALGPAGQQAAP